MGARLIPDFIQSSLEGKGVSGKGSKVPVGSMQGPVMIDIPQLISTKVKFAIKGRLRTLGPNSAFESKFYNEVS